MKNSLVFFAILLALALVLAACTTQEATNEPGEVTALPTVATEAATVTQEAGEAALTPTAASEGNTPTPEAGGTAAIPETGSGVAGAPDDLDDILRVLRAVGANVELGDTVEQDFTSIPGQILRINGEEVQIFTYDTAEALQAQASQLAEQTDPEREPQFYTLGNMLVRYVGREPGVRSLLENVLGARAAGR